MTRLRLRKALAHVLFVAFDRKKHRATAGILFRVQRVPLRALLMLSLVFVHGVMVGTDRVRWSDFEPPNLHRRAALSVPRHPVDRLFAPLSYSCIAYYAAEVSVSRYLSHVSVRRRGPGARRRSVAARVERAARIIGIKSFWRRETRTRSGVGKRRYIRLTPCRRSSDSNRGSNQEKGSKYNFHCRISKKKKKKKAPPCRCRSRLQRKPREVHHER